MGNNHSQHHEMQQLFDRFLMGNVLFSIFSWMGFFAFSEGNISKDWPTGPIWIVLGIAVYLASTLVKRDLHRAYKFHYLVFFQSTINAMLLFDGSFRLIIESMNLSGESLFWFLSFSMLFALLGFLSQLRLIQMELNASFNDNMKNGRLNLSEKRWNLSAPLYLDSPAKEISKTRTLNRLFKLSPLVTALGFSLARAIEGPLQMLAFAICLYLLGYVIVWGYAKHLAIAIKLREWEGVYKTVIKL